MGYSTSKTRYGTTLNSRDILFVCAVSSKYDPVLKRAKKISGRLLGKITEQEGFIVSSKDKLRQKADQSMKVDKLTTKEFGTQELVLQLAEKQVSVLERVFGEDAKPLFLFALFRLTEQSPIKNVSFYFMHSFLSETWKDVSVSDKSISHLLRRVGSNREKIMEYQKHFVKEGERVLLDMTHVITHSRQIEAVQSGYNNSMSFDPQVNLMYLFSADRHEPVYYRLLPGNIRDVKAFTLTMQECGLKNVTLIADKGFYEKQIHFGTVALINNNKDKTPEEVYVQYKARTNVESMFDAMKNVVEADRTYMQNDKAMEGWMFVNHIALQCYYLIYQKLIEHKLLKKYSVTDFLKFTHRVKKVKINGNWHLAEITKPVMEVLQKLNLHIT